MEKCVHVSKIRPAWDHSILNPEKWMCYVCRTTESVWACLSCSNVACGRFNEKHALKHFEESKHPISIEVNDKYVYCYVCDDYVLNDNAPGDIKLLRSALSAIATQKFTDIESRGRKLLRSYSHSGVVQRDNTDDDDKVATAEWHQKRRLLAKTFTAWRTLVQQQKAASRDKDRPLRRQDIEAAVPSSSMLRRTIIPGVTGLRNLGNTCYMNSVLQIVSHIEDFRSFFLKMKYNCDVSPNGSPQVTAQKKAMMRPQKSFVPSPSSALPYTRQTTVECFQHLMAPEHYSIKKAQNRTGGLNGGSAEATPLRQHLICDVESRGSKSGDGNISLCGELHGVLRVLWSGKWAQVSPHAFLRAVWLAIPSFKGYAQHDAQEFLCELLDKVQRELDTVPKKLQRADVRLLTNLFQGQLVSQVTCLRCGNVSSTYEPYMDLSLEFPNRYQITKSNSRVSEDICHITEMLATFTEEEHLDGEIYNCAKCNKKRKKSAGIRYTSAKKQLLIHQIPPFLRLHLKRFRWSGRIHREKIKTHVATDEVLDLRPFCSGGVAHSTYNYRLFGVIIHHGKGFGAGHYTAYTWNSEADSWVHCNDSRMMLSTLEDVLSAQAYILFYKKDDTDMPPPLYSLSSTDTIICSQSSMDSLDDQVVPKLDKKPVLKSDGTFELVNDDGELPSSSKAGVKVVDNEVSFNFKPSPSPKGNPKVSPTGSSKVSAKVSPQGSSPRVTRSGKRLLDSGGVGDKGAEDQIRVKDAKRKKLIFDTDTFYAAGSKTPPRKPTQVPKNKKGLPNSGQKLSNSAGKNLKKKAVLELTARHLKRRKTTFW